MRIAVRVTEGFDDLARSVGALDGVELIRCDDDATTVDGVRRSEALVIGGSHYRPAVVDALRDPRCPVRWLQFAAAGFDAAVRFGVPPGVVLTNAAAAFAPIVAEHAFALLLAGKRRIVEMDRTRQTPEWTRDRFVPSLSSVESATVLIVGYGHIGRELVRRAVAFGMHPVVVTRRPDAVATVDLEAHPLRSLRALLARADAVVVAIALTAATRKLIGRTELEAMRSSAWLVNVARGAVIDEAALVDALRSQRIAGAALDVFEDEPLALASPLRGLSNAILSPHVAGFGSAAARARLAAIVADNVARFAAGQPLDNVVDPEAYSRR